MILLIPIVLLIIGYFLSQSWRFEILGVIINVFSGIVLFILLIWFASVRFVTTTYPEKREALQSSYEQSREMSEFERATITKDIAEFNKNLAVDKYWNNTILFDWFVHDSVENVDPIK